MSARPPHFVFLVLALMAAGQDSCLQAEVAARLEGAVQPATSDVSSEDRFGSPLAADGDLLAVAASGWPTGGAGQIPGAVHLYRRDGSAWAWEARLELPGDYFPGTMYAFGRALAMQGNTLVVGAVGGVFVYVRQSGVWSLEGSLSLESENADHFDFGRSVALDGDTIAVSAPGDGDTIEGGPVSVFVRENGVWSREATLPGPGCYSEPCPLVSLAGDVLLISTDEAPAGNGTLGGEVIVYERTGTVWTPAPSLRAPADGLDLYRGFARSMAREGDIVAVGAWPYYTGDAFIPVVRVFERGPAGWALTAAIPGPGGLADVAYGRELEVRGGQVFVSDSAGGSLVFSKQGDVWQQAGTSPQEPFWAARPVLPPLPEVLFADSVREFGLHIETAAGTATVLSLWKLHIIRKVNGSWLYEADLGRAGGDGYWLQLSAIDAATGNVVAVLSGEQQPGGGAAVVIHERTDSRWPEQARIPMLQPVEALALESGTLVLATAAFPGPVTLHGFQQNTDGTWDAQPIVQVPGRSPALALRGGLLLVHTTAGLFEVPKAGGAWGVPVLVSPLAALGSFAHRIFLDGQRAVLASASGTHILARQAGGGWTHEAMLPAGGWIRGFEGGRVLILSGSFQVTVTIYKPTPAGWIPTNLPNFSGAGSEYGMPYSTALYGSEVLMGHPFLTTAHPVTGVPLVRQGKVVVLRLADASGWGSQQHWRYDNFGSPDNAGPGANLADPDGDGIDNLMEFATGTDPLRGLDRESLTAYFTPEGPLLRYQKAGAAVVAGLQWIVEWSENLDATAWRTDGVVTTPVNAWDGNEEALVPSVGRGRLFVRLRVVAGAPPAQ